MLLATVAFGAYTVLVGRKPAELPITAFVFSTFALGLVMLLPAYLVELSRTGPFTVDRSTTAALLYIGIFPSLLAFFAWNRAVTTIGATRPAIIYYLVPVFTGLGAWLLLDEPIGPAEIASMILVIAGVSISQLSRLRHPRTARPSQAGGQGVM
jgi:drug/metabolite transporter (DMT)-like permease